MTPDTSWVCYHEAMQINPGQAQKLHRLGDALRQQILFEAIRNDDEKSVLEYFQANGSPTPDDMGNVLLETVDLATTIGLSFNAQKCLPHLLPRLPLEMLKGATLSRVVEKDQLEGFRAIVSFSPFTTQEYFEQLDRAVFSNSPKVLEALLGMGPAPQGHLDIYRQSVLRGTPKFECLQVLVQYAPCPKGCLEALLEAVIQGKSASIELLLPHVDKARACQEMLSTTPALAPPVLATIDTHLVPYLSEDELTAVLPLFERLPDPSQLPSLQARSHARQLQEQTATSPTRSAAPRL